MSGLYAPLRRTADALQHAQTVTDRTLGSGTMAFHDVVPARRAISAALRAAQRELDGLRVVAQVLAPLHLRMARLALGLTEPQLAKLAKVTAGTVHQLELGAHRPRQATLRRIVAALQAASRKQRRGAELESAIGAMGADLCHALPLAPPTASWPLEG